MSQHNPRSPSFPLGEAIELGEQIYGETLCHVVDPDTAAVCLGYKNSRGGAAQKKLGTLRYFAVIESEGRGKLKVSDKIQDYKFATDANTKAKIVDDLFRQPKVYSTILEKYDGHLPTDPVLKLFLIKELKFTPDGADNLIAIFRASLAFVESHKNEAHMETMETPPSLPADMDKGDNHENADTRKESRETTPLSEASQTTRVLEDKNIPIGAEYDKIPIRLPNVRKAWLIIPGDFAESDKSVIKKQIDAIWTEE